MTLSDDRRDYFEDLLRAITLDRAKIREGMSALIWFSLFSFCCLCFLVWSFYKFVFTFFVFLQIITHFYKVSLLRFFYYYCFSFVSLDFHNFLIYLFIYLLISAAFALDCVEHAAEIINTLKESLTLSETPPLTKVQLRSFSLTIRGICVPSPLIPLLYAIFVISLRFSLSVALLFLKFSFFLSVSFLFVCL